MNQDGLLESYRSLLGPNFHKASPSETLRFGVARAAEGEPFETADVLAMGDSSFDAHMAHEAPSLLDEALGHPSAAVPVPAGGPRSLSALALAADNGRFTILDVIGEGGMGTVRAARQVALDRIVAVKSVKGPRHHTSNRRFLAEAHLSALLEHPNIVPVHDLFALDDGTSALAMKLVRGRTWHEILYAPRGEDRRDLSFHLDVFAKAADAIAFAHDKGFLHMDMKPANVMVGAFGEVLVMDWGLAVDIREPMPTKRLVAHKVTINLPCGTPHYMAPEQAAGRGPDLGPWTDVFVLGAVLYEVLMGRPPHDGPAFVDVIKNAVYCTPPRFDSRAPPGLREICEKAMAPNPEDRYRTVGELKAAIRSYETRKESLALSREGSILLENTRDTIGREPPGPMPSMTRDQVYEALREAHAHFRQALTLWPENERARAGVDGSALNLAEVAIRNGDLGLASQETARLPPTSDVAHRLRAAIDEKEAKRAKSIAAGRRLRTYVRVLVTATILLLVGGILRVQMVKARREEAAALAELRLANIMRLADTKIVETLRTGAKALAPAAPETLPRFDAWLVEARALVARLPAHRAFLAEIRERAVADGHGGFALPTANLQWVNDTMAALVTDVEALERDVLPRVERARAFAATVHQRSLVDGRAAWDEAILGIADESIAPYYRGLRIRPQLGLIPLGRDPKSGLWEFAHLESGEPPSRDAQGNIVPTPAMGVVLVLLPGGRFLMGSEPPSAAHPLGSPNVDPEAGTLTGPIHEVDLAPFFLAKYEFTQGQWERATGRNPSGWAPPGAPDMPIDLLHPVEQVTWAEATQMLEHLSLSLPTEAQWEYAARGGTGTPWWTGTTVASLSGAANVADLHAKTHGRGVSWSFETTLDDGFVAHAPVGRFRANPFGLHDTAGNVWEWCADGYASYSQPVRPLTGEREAPNDAPHPFRGGGFRSSGANAKAGDRYGFYATDYRGFDVGFRAARGVE